ncbi:TRAP transporter small permease [Pseudogracilibacillus auburnensis]|uniref:C4-dicarboxylate transporter DctQ subunit n=1 Tax=Pseudogracilibacillus auburnensis TaxID=1494959 RepID=A0A2V3W1P4_9BACI|nr:TRAP transporter small permease [Pseudogracilibacillus auburnensis]MBO1002995.1 TRAP transporter small permease [Pseudogracilibacillus auburnensis]PXW87094.1 C4-dicarboxylate transporter DctQ subunit [Pseudogracilibacillus auburnensis]
MNVKTLLDKRMEEFILVLTMAIMVLIMFIQSTSRYFFGFSFSWGSEFAQYLHVWQIWIGASLAVRLQSHIRVDVFIKLFPQTIQRFINFLALVCWFIFAGFLAFEGSKYVIDMLASGQTSPSLQVPMWIPYLAIPIGGTLMVIRLIQQMYLLFTNKDGLYGKEEIQ